MFKTFHIFLERDMLNGVKIPSKEFSHTHGPLYRQSLSLRFLLQKDGDRNYEKIGYHFKEIWRVSYILKTLLSLTVIRINDSLAQARRKSGHAGHCYQIIEKNCFQYLWLLFTILKSQRSARCEKISTNI